MKKVLLFILVTFFLPYSSLWAQYELKSWSFQPQAGVWFGPVAAVPGTELSRVLSTYLGGGIFGRANLPTNLFHSEVGASYNVYGRVGQEKLQVSPVYGAIDFKLPIEFALNFYFKGGAGGSYVKNSPENHSNWLPTGFLGFETSFPAGKWVNIGLRADYYLLYEKHLKAPVDNPGMKIINGHFINIGLMLNVNILAD